MKTVTQNKLQKRNRRHARIRGKVSGTETMPRLAVFRSNRFIYAQIIDDTTGTTLASSADMGGKVTGTKTSRALEVGKTLAANAKTKGISNVVFDRGGFKYTGRVAALAEGARQGGLIF